MIKYYQFHSKSLGTIVTVGYDDGILKSMEAQEPQVDTDGLWSLFKREAQFLEEAAKKGVKVTPLKREITFDMFWDRYAYKISGKPEAQKAWNKLSRADQAAAYDHIPVYEGQLKLNPVAKLYGSSYLNAKRWIK